MVGQAAALAETDEEPAGRGALLGSFGTALLLTHFYLNGGPERLVWLKMMLGKA
jgi:hypothetical protein